MSGSVKAGLPSEKRLSPALIFAFILLLSLWSQAWSRTVRVAVYDNPPKTYLTKDGRGDGIFIDILAEIAKREDWELEFVPGTWDESLQRVLTSQVDIMPDMAYNQEREQLFSFHNEPVLSSWSQIYARKGLGVKAIPDMAGMRVAVLEGSVQQTALQEIVNSFNLDVRFESFRSFGDAFKAVSNGDADLVATNMFYGAFNAREYHLEDTSIVFEPSKLFYVTRKGRNLDLLEAIDIQLRDLKEDPDSPYYQAIKNWQPISTKYVIPTSLKVLALVLALGLVFGIISFFVLKHQVKVRTLELSESNREMESRIILRTAELENAMRQAQESDVLKSAFLATMSHELRTPLNSIIGFTGILLQGLPGELNEEQRKQLSMVQKSARHLLMLINDVLDISKIEAGQLDLNPETFSLSESLAKIHDIMLPAAEAKSLVISCELNPKDQVLYTDKRRLEQIVMNLLSNAIKFTDHGSVSIIAYAEDQQIKIEVRDTGIGISEADQNKLFKPFRQIDSGLTRRYDGTGLGLSICKRLSRLLGGDITVQSKAGKGSTFIVRIPSKLEVKS